jgi:putative nucleotidyltransferase with HDIG domain
VKRCKAPERDVSGKPDGLAIKTRAGGRLNRFRIPGSAKDLGYADETEAILFSLAQAVEQRDQATAGHCERLAVISVTLGMAMHLPQESLLSLYRGGYLHDIGKVGIPDSILFKPGRLTADEWVTMRTHTIRGEEICRPLKSLKDVLPIIRNHHERWDGSGYPDGFRGEQIPLLARVLQAADIYDALTSPRPYKPPIPPQRALEIMAEETDRGWRDPTVMSLFFRLHDDVISNIAEYNDDADGALERMRSSMRNLQEVLEKETAPVG